jgi:hypothetical protein
MFLGLEGFAGSLGRDRDEIGPTDCVVGARVFVCFLSPIRSHGGRFGQPGVTYDISFTTLDKLVSLCFIVNKVGAFRRLFFRFVCCPFDVAVSLATCFC